MVTPLAIALLLLALQAQPAVRADGAAELQALFAEAVRLQQARDLEGAAEAYGRFLQKQPRNVEALSNLGAVLTAQGRYEDATARYREALGVDPARTAVRLNLALALEKAGRPADAATELERVVAQAPENRNAIVLLAECRVRLGEPGRAVALLRPLQEKNPEDRAVTYLLGYSLLEDKQLEPSKVLLDRVLRDGESAETHLLLGAMKLSAGDYPAARDDLGRAAAMNPALPMVHVLLGRALMNVGDGQAAAEEFRRELAARPNDFDANLFLGVLLKQDNALGEAMARFEKAASLRPGDPAALYQVGSLRLQLGETDGAREVLERVVSSAPDFVEAHVSLALVYYRLKRKADGDRERDLVQQLERTRQAEQPGAKAGGEVYRGEPRLPAPAKKNPTPP
jgi:tetratricopeptide (TPR) repeat protein